MSRKERRAGGGASRRRTTATADSGGGGGPRLSWLVVFLAVGVGLAALVAYLIWQQSQAPSSRLDDDRQVEENADPALPGEWVNLPEIYANGSDLAHYGETPGTAPHVTRDVDYSDQGLPPAGGPHWGSSACGGNPDEAPAFCGPVAPGIYSQPWPAESLIHTMEHAGVVIWYNTDDEAVVDQLADFARDNSDKNLVLTPYFEMEEEHIAITVWSRRDMFPVSEYDNDRLDDFLDELYCVFDPEDFC